MSDQVPATDFVSTRFLQLSKMLFYFTAETYRFIEVFFAIDRLGVLTAHCGDHGHVRCGPGWNSPSYN